MKKRTLNLAILFMVIYTTFFVAVTFFSLTYINKFFDTKLQEQRFEISKITRTELDESIKRNYSDFLSLLEEHDNEALNSNINSLGSINYQLFGNLTNEKIVLNNKTYGLRVPSDLSYFNLPISIYKFDDMFDFKDDEISFNNKTFIVFRNEDRFAYFEAEEYFKLLIKEEKYLITNENGRILNYLTKTTNLTNIHSFFKDVNTTSVIEELKDKQEKYQAIDTLDEKYIVSYLPLLEAPGYYYMNLYPYHDFLVAKTNQYLVAVLLIIVSEIIFFILSFSFSKLMTSSYRDLELSYYYQNSNSIPIIEVNKNGRIIRKNKEFIKELPHFKSCQKIEDFLDAEMIDVTKLTPFKSWFISEVNQYTGTVIIPIKTRMLTYTLLFYPFYLDVTDSLVIGSIQQTVGIPSLNNYKHDVDQILTRKKTYHHTQAVTVLRVNNLSSFEVLRGEHFASNLINKLYHQLVEMMDSELDVELYLTFDNSFIILYRDSNINDVKNDIRRILVSHQKELTVLEYVVQIELVAGIYPFNYKTERSSALSMYDKAKKALEKKEAFEDVLMGVYDAVTEAKDQKLDQLRDDLELGIKEKEFEMFFQPQYNNEEKYIEGFEALVRWMSPKHKDTSIEDFIRVAEESDAILRLGEIIIDKSLEALKKLEEYDITISINISPNQFLQAGFVTHIEEAISRHNVDPAQVILEITETALIVSFEDIVEKIKALQRLGIKIHIDDFGKGQSSLLYIKELEMDGIKVDRDFVIDILTDKYSKAVVGMIINLAKSLDLDLVVEGVETIKQNEYLYKQGVKVIQGYLISRPVPFENAKELLLEYNKYRPKKKKGVVTR